MTKEEKQILLKDLCARLPYGVVCKISYTFNNETTNWEDVESTCDDIITKINFDTKEVFSDWLSEYSSIDDVKPYLRPMSSMTDKEKEEFRSLSDNIQVEYGKGYGYFFLHCIRLGILPGNPHECIDDFIDMSAIDWLNEHHFDYRGLIDKGLALEAPKDMYKTE